MSSKIRFASLRTSLFTVLGLSVAACGGSVTTSEVDRPDPEGSGGADGGADGGAGGSGGGGGGFAGLCEGAQEIIARGGVRSGFWHCPDGTVHRVEAVHSDATNDGPFCTGTESSRNCDSDADCTDGAHGRCISTTHADELGGNVRQRCGCQYSCASDNDCKTGQACIPGKVIHGEAVSFCARAECRTGADCASGECGLSVHFNGCYLEVSLACRSATDECRIDSECGGFAEEQCIAAGSRFQCMGPNCAIGRPLLIDGRARTAAPQSRDDWATSPLLPDLTGLDPALRNTLANHWLEVAAMEHASIGSFARFSLQLLALGAPPDLLADTQKAALDEVEHARIAYALASAYAGRKLGPGPLDTSDAPLVTCRKEAIRSLIAEACVSETLGVAEATAIADGVRDPILAGILRRIAEDERRHAELAFRTLAWLLENASPDESDEAELAFAEAIRASARDPEVSRASIPEHGVLDAKALGSLRRQALTEVVEPCAAALLERSKMAA